MASPFSRTMRSLYADRFYVSLAGLIVAIVLAIIWGHWFFTAQVTFYETSRNVYVTGKESVIEEFSTEARGGVQRGHATRRRIVVAEFPPDAKNRIQQRQAAFLYLDNRAGRQAGAIPAVVMNIADNHSKKVVQVELYAEIDADAPNPFEEGAGGEAKIEVEHVTPATLVMHASGLFTETPPTSYSPQKKR